MTNQDAFTLVVQHLRTQGGPSIDGTNCVYRHPDGIKRCAVGVLIADDDYKVVYESNTVIILPEIPSLDGISITLLTEMQKTHDYIAVTKGSLPWAARMENAYIDIAKQFDLTVPLHPCGIPQDHTTTPEVDTLIHQSA